MINDDSMSDEPISNKMKLPFIALSIIVSSLIFLSACSSEKFSPAPDCNNQPQMVSDCMIKEGCGIEGGDNVNYKSCKYTCQYYVERQCRMAKIAKKSSDKR